MALSLAPRGQPEHSQRGFQIAALGASSGANSPQPRFSSLGGSLLERIYSFCDDSELLLLGKTCKSFNTTALRFLFLRNDSARWMFGMSLSLVELRKWGPYVTPALCIAHFVEPPTVFVYGFQPDSDMIFSDLHHLAHFLGPPPGTAYHSHVQFSFSGIDGKIIKGFPDPFIDFDRFLEHFKRLLDVAVKRGTAELSVIGGWWFLEIHRDRVPQWLTAYSVRNQDGSGESPVSYQAVEYNPPVVFSPAAVKNHPPALTRSTPIQRLPRSNFVVDLTGRLKQRFGFSRKRQIPAPSAYLPTTQEDTSIPIGVSQSASPADETKDLVIGAKPTSTTSTVDDGDNAGLPTLETEVQERDDDAAEARSGVLDGTDVEGALTAVEEPPLKSQLSPLATSPANSTKLTILKADSPLLFQPPILDWLLNTLAASPSIKTLEFREIDVDHAIWSRVLSSFYLPKLQKLSFDRTGRVPTFTGISVGDLRAFLFRHTTITRFDVGGIVFNGPKDVESFNQRADLLPNLEHLGSDPFFAKVFLGQPNGPQVYSRLSSIGINGEHEWASDSPSARTTYDYTSYAPALQAITLYPQVETLCLTFPMVFDDSTVTWLRAQVDLGKQSLIAPLFSIKHLVLKFGYWINFGLESRSLLRKFVGRFPSVESVHFDEVDLEMQEAMEKERFEMMLANECPKLKRYKLGDRDSVVLEGIMKRIGFRLHIG